MLALIRLVFRALMMSDSDPRMVALRRHADDAFGKGHKVEITAFSNDEWAWALGKTASGEFVSLDVRGPGCATAALAGAMRVIAESGRPARRETVRGVS